ncbi:hypothetical protein CERZMDRAFT_88231 [Cercospora zeae-maydis SCOH1-5]|uniref:Uncharacterized protein n=1 Tax=Cercospora zeae-maydis SCOH1-5 TaxID=717836 RepID=A0A6A6EZX1_9PEZI|nr:hypothetical protein CERZMDRAFT_88231 [Cercospora zeae-maydis SCOH1-5]
MTALEKRKEVGWIAHNEKDKARLIVIESPGELARGLENRLSLTNRSDRSSLQQLTFFTCSVLPFVMGLASAGASVRSPAKIRRQSKGISKSAIKRRHSKGRTSKSPHLRKCASSVPQRPTIVTIRVAFDNVNLAKCDKVLWKPCSFHLSIAEPLRSLPFLFEALVEQRLRKDVFFNDKLRREQHVVKLSSHIVPPGDDNNEIISLDKDPRIAVLSDLFSDPRAPELVLTARIKLTVQEINQEGTTPQDEQIQLPTWHDPTDSYRILRIGFVPLQNGDEAELAEKVHDNRRNDVAYMQALMIWIHRESGGYHLRRCHAFEFDDFCIGDPFEDTSWNRRTFSNRDYFLGRLASVQKNAGSKDNFWQLIKELLSEENEDEYEDAQMGSGIPFLPTYCYNEFRPAELGIGLLKWPKRGIDVAATFVNKYDRIKKLTFKRDVRVVVEKGDGFDDVVACLLKEIDCKGWEHGICSNSAQLFGDKHRGKWKVLLWVMPQLEQRKLYRYTSGDLLRFLSPALTVRTTDKRLDVVLQYRPSSTAPEDLEDTAIIDFIASELHMNPEDIAETVMHFKSQICIKQNHRPIRQWASASTLLGKDILLHIASGPSNFDQADGIEHSGRATSSRSRKPRNKGKGVNAEESEVPESESGPRRQTRKPETAGQSAEDGAIEQENENVPSENRVSFRSDAKITNLTETAKTLVQGRIDDNEALRKADEDARLGVPFRASIEKPNAEGVWLSLSDNTFNVRHIKDLFRDPSVPVPLQVHVIFDIEISEEEPIEPTPGIHQPSYKGYEIIRLGYKKTAQVNGSQRGARYAPDSERPLLAWRCEGDTDPMSLFSIHAYDFGDYCIGDSETLHVYEAESFNTPRQLLDPFDGIKQKEELQNAIEAYLTKKPRPKVGSGVPFIPSYCFNKIKYLDIDQTGFGVKDGTLRDDFKVEIAVRCVGHLPQPDEFGKRTDFIEFPQSVLLELAANSDANDFWEKIIPELQAKNETGLTGQLHSTSDDSEKFRTSATLWTEPLQGTWAVQLWVSLQMHDARDRDRKMYLFPRAAPKERPITLSRFLDSKSLRSRVRRCTLKFIFCQKTPENG